MKFIVLLGLVFFQLPSHASPFQSWANKNKGHCFEQHLKEARFVNHIRGETYSDLSFGDSKKVSNFLVFLDTIGIPFGMNYDSQSRKLMRGGELDLVCKFIPSFMPVLDKPIPEARYPQSDFRAFKVSSAHHLARVAYDDGGLVKVKPVIERELGILNEAPEYNCMARHFLKSMKRLIEVAQVDGRDSVKEFSWKMIHQTFLQLRVMGILDRMAAPIQAEGLGIICNELPDIPQF